MVTVVHFSKGVFYIYGELIRLWLFAAAVVKISSQPLPPGHSHNSSNPAPKAKSRPRTTFLCCLPTQNPSAAETVRRELPLGFRHKLFPWNSSVLVFDDTGAPSSESSTDPAEIERMVAAVMDLPPEAKKELKEILVDSRVLRLDFQGKSGANIAGGVSWRVMTPEEEEWADALMQEGAEQVRRIFFRFSQESQSVQIGSQ